MKVRKLFSALLAIAALRCGTSVTEPEINGCPPSLFRAVFSVVGNAPDLLVFDKDGLPIPTGQNVGVGYDFDLNKNSAPTPSRFGIVFDINGAIANSRYIFYAFTTSGEEFVISDVGDRYSAPMKGWVILEGRHPCKEQPQLAVIAEILGARGAIDTHALTIDGDFWRRVAIDVDWSNVGCGVGAVRGKVVFDVVAASLAYNCADTFRIIGNIEPPPADMDASTDAADE